MDHDEWEGLIEAAHACPDLRMEVLRDFLRTLSALGGTWDEVRWIKKIADILPDALTREALGVVGGLADRNRAESFTALLDLAARVPGCIDSLIRYAKALAPGEALALLLGVAERCGDRREALLADVVAAIPTVDSAISRFEVALRAYRLRACDGADQAELDTLIAVLRREGAAASYFGFGWERPGLPRALIQDALENALGQEQPAARFQALEALAPHLDVAQLGRAWDELDRIGDASDINYAKSYVLEIASVAQCNGIDGSAWLVAAEKAPDRATREAGAGPQRLLRFLATLLVRSCNPERRGPATWILLPHLIRMGETETAIALARALPQQSRARGLFDAEYTARLIAPHLDRQALTEWATLLVEMTNAGAAAREFAALAASLPKSVRESTARRLRERLDRYPPDRASPGNAALLVAEGDAALPSARDRLFEGALAAKPIDCETLLVLEAILDETQYGEPSRRSSRFTIMDG